MRVHRTAAVLEEDGWLNLRLHGLPFRRGERVEVVVIEPVTDPASAGALEYRTPPPASAPVGDSGEWMLLGVVGLIILVFCLLWPLV
jgi:hypothetical protein